MTNTILPECSMPDGADPCAGYAQLYAENLELREVIRLAGGWLELDGSYTWTFWNPDGSTVRMPVQQWLEERQKAARALGAHQEALFA